MELAEGALQGWEHLQGSVNPRGCPGAPPHNTGLINALSGLAASFPCLAPLLSASGLRLPTAAAGGGLEKSLPFHELTTPKHSRWVAQSLKLCWDILVTGLGVEEAQWAGDLVSGCLAPPPHTIGCELDPDSPCALPGVEGSSSCAPPPRSFLRRWEESGQGVI